MVDSLLKPADISKILGVSKSFAYQLIRTGEIVSLRMGKAVRVRPTDLEAYVYAHLSGNPVAASSNLAKK
jgi:excisionase family DNA binding protein